MIRINLLPVRQSRKKLAGRQQLLLFGLSLVLVLMCNFWWSRSTASTLAAAEAKLRGTRTDVAQLDAVIGEVKSIRQQASSLKDKLAVLDKLKAGRQGPVRVLDDLAGLTPKRLWLRKLEEKDGAVTFEGAALSIDDVSAFLAALKTSQYFSAPELKKTSGKSDGRSEGKVTLVEFTINAKVNYTPTVPVSLAGVAPGSPAQVNPR